MFVFLGDEPRFFQTIGFIVIGDLRALQIPTPDILPPPPPKKVEREERGLSAESTPVPSKVCSDSYSCEVVTFADENVQRDKETKGKDTDVSKIREKHAQDKASTR